MKADKKQLSIIHIAKTQLGLDDDLYRETLEAQFGVSSSKDLTYNQAGALIDFFKTKGFKIKTSKRAPKLTRNDKVVRLATDSQRRLIEVLKKNIVWKKENGFELYIKKRFNINKVITMDDAFKVINGLKAILKINTKIIELEALPFPWNPEKAWFKNQGFAWFFDLSKGQLVKLNEKGEEIV